jgi:hypothetical protein
VGRLARIEKIKSNVLVKRKSFGKSRENIKIDIKKHNECKLDLTG